MGQTKKKHVIKILATVVALCLGGAMLESCHNSRKCGCGHDLNGVYKKGKHRW